MKVRTEYRINKKGAECYRTTDGRTAYAKLAELQAKRPGVYTMQMRTCNLDRHGVMMTDCSMRPLWTAWR